MFKVARLGAFKPAAAAIGRGPRLSSPGGVASIGGPNRTPAHCLDPGPFVPAAHGPGRAGAGFGHHPLLPPRRRVRRLGPARLGRRRHHRGVGRAARTTGEDDFGVYWEVPIKPDAERLGFIVHKGDEKDPGPDMFLDLTQASEAWIISGDLLALHRAARPQRPPGRRSQQAARPLGNARHHRLSRR